MKVKAFLVRIDFIRWHKSSVGSDWSSLVLRGSSYALIPSSWGMLMHSEETSRVTKRLPDGKGGQLAKFIDEVRRIPNV